MTAAAWDHTQAEPRMKLPTISAMMKRVTSFILAGEATSSIYVR